MDAPAENKIRVKENPTSVSDSSWPNLFGPNHQSQIVDSNLPGHLTEVPNEVWRIPVGTGYSAPVLADDRVFLSHRLKDEEIIECFSAIDGTSQWKFAFPATYECTFEYSSGPYSTLVLAEDNLIAVGQSGHTYCLQQRDGKKVWSRDLFADYQLSPGEWPVAASGIIVKDTFIFNLGGTKANAGIIALDINTGETRWTNTQHEAGHATPNLMKVGNRTYVLMVTGNGLHSIDAASGKECWFLPLRRKKAETYNAVSPVVFKDIACMVTGPGPGTMVVRVDAKNVPEILWQNRRILDSQYTNLICIDGFLFGFTPMKQGGPELRCIDLPNEKLCWKWKAKLGRAMMVVCNETIIILGEKGNLAAIELSSSGVKELFRTESPVLSQPCYSAPAIYDSKLYLRNEKNLVCLQLR